MKDLATEMREAYQDSGFDLRRPDMDGFIDRMLRLLPGAEVANGGWIGASSPDHDSVSFEASDGSQSLYRQKWARGTFRALCARLGTWAESHGSTGFDIYFGDHSVKLDGRGQTLRVRLTYTNTTRKQTFRISRL